MGYFVAYVIGLFIMALTELVLALVLGVVGGYVASAGLLGLLLYEMHQAVRRGKSDAATALLISGVSVLLPFTLGVVNVPGKWGPWAALSGRMEQLYTTGAINDGLALLVQLMIWLWVFGGGALIVHAFGEIIEVADGDGDEGLLVHWTVLIVIWGLTAGSFLGWMLGGLPGAILGKY